MTQLEQQRTRRQHSNPGHRLSPGGAGLKLSCNAGSFVDRTITEAQTGATPRRPAVPTPTRA